VLSKVITWLEELSTIANRNQKLAKMNGTEFIWYSADKNKDIKRKFSEEGEKLPTNGRLSSRSSGKSSGREWLYDFTLREFDSRDQLINIPLVAELEFSDSKVNGLIYDFNKLLQSDADYKVFIFQQKQHSDTEHFFECISNSVDAYNHKSSSEYLIVCWITSEYKFVYKALIGSRNSNHMQTFVS